MLEGIIERLTEQLPSSLLTEVSETLKLAAKHSEENKGLKTRIQEIEDSARELQELLNRSEKADSILKRNEEVLAEIKRSKETLELDTIKFEAQKELISLRAKLEAQSSVVENAKWFYSLPFKNRSVRESVIQPLKNGEVNQYTHMDNQGNSHYTVVDQGERLEIHEKEKVEE